MYLKNCSADIAEEESQSDSTCSEENAFTEQQQDEFQLTSHKEANWLY